jgi:hypothetical protein
MLVLPFNISPLELVFEIVKSLSNEHTGSRADIYDIALKIAKNNEKLVYSAE